MRIWHLVLSTVGREAMFTQPGERRRAVRTLVRVATGRLASFGLVDEHAHALVFGEQPRQLGGHIALALSALPGAVPFQPCWAEAPEDRAHLRRLMAYVLTQSEKHGLGPTATWEGSAFRDLVGARRLEGFDPELWRVALPREDERLIWEAVGLEKPAGVSVSGHSLGAITAAAALVTGADAALEGRSAEVMRARRVAIALAREAGFSAAQVAAALRCDPHTVRRLGLGADDADVRAARRTLAIDAAVARRAQRAA